MPLSAERTGEGRRYQALLQEVAHHGARGRGHDHLTGGFVGAAGAGIDVAAGAEPAGAGLVEGHAKGTRLRLLLPAEVPLPASRDGVGGVSALGQPAELHEGGIEQPDAVAGLDSVHLGPMVRQRLPTCTPGHAREGDEGGNQVDDEVNLP